MVLDLAEQNIKTIQQKEQMKTAGGLHRPQKSIVQNGWMKK